MISDGSSEVLQRMKKKESGKYVDKSTQCNVGHNTLMMSYEIEK